MPNFKPKNGGTIAHIWHQFAHGVQEIKSYTFNNAIHQNNPWIQITVVYILYT